MLYRYTTFEEKSRDFAIGLLLFFGLILLFWFLYLTSQNEIFLSALFLIYPVLMILFGVTRYWIALGMLSIIALAFVLSILASIFVLVLCFALIGNR